VSAAPKRSTPGQRLLLPARWLMDRLTYPRKFALVSLLFVLPLVAVLYFLLAEINNGVEFAQKEIKGNEYLRTVRHLQHEVGEGQYLATLYAQNKTVLRPDLVRQQSRIDDVVAHLLKVDKDLDQALNTASPLAVLQENHRFLRGQLFGSDDKLAPALHKQLLRDVGKLNAHVGDTSNLILDPQLDSYYLMDTMLLKLPASADLLVELRMLLAGITNRGFIRPDERSEFARLAGLLESEAQNVSNGLKVSYSNTRSADLATQLNSEASVYDQNLIRLVKSLRIELEASTDLTGMTARIDGHISEAKQANWALADRVSVELDKLFAARIHSLERKQQWTVAFSVVSLALVAYLLLAFYASVMGIVKRLRSASERMRTGDFSDTLTLETRDELGQVANAFNTVALRLREEKHQADEESSRARAAEAEVREHEQQLVASREEALAAVRAKAAFLATMSHEIRTPLNGVVGMSTLLGETQLNPEQRDYLQTIRLSSDQLLGVINDILDFSKIESGKLDLESEPLALRNAVEEACDIAAPRAREKGLELIIDMPEPRAGGLPAGVLGDVTRLRQVLINLINNAVKFTEKGEVAIHVRLLHDANDKGHPVIEFRVTDTGIGIPPERVTQLFQAFTQVDASTTRKYGGTGLGLAISKRIVELMGGEIGVESELGKGSTFWFTMAGPVADVAPAFGPSDASMLRGRRALVVDDNATNIRILRRQLQLWGMEVASADSGAQALEVLDPAVGAVSVAWVPDIIVTDMHMPEMDGVTLAQQIKTRPLVRGIPLVMLSSGFMPTGEAGAALFAARLLKPARQNQLFDTLARCLSHDPAAHKKAEMATVDVTKNITIMVADDNAVNLKVASAMLRKLGYGIVTTTDGRETVEVLAAAMRNHPVGSPPPFGAILMDVNMPDVDGLQATRQIRAAWGNLSPPIIAVTAAATDDDRARCMDAGMDDYLTKPLQVAGLAHALEKWTARAAPKPSESPATAPVHSAKENPDVVVLDDSRLLEFIEFDDEERSMTREVVALFIKDAPMRIRAIEQAAATADLQSLSREAHSLKGSASNIGAVALYTVCARIEADAISGCVNATTDQVAQLQNLWVKTGAALDQYAVTTN
jgi:signal transduction histidine kinase/DNA-binding response OmpR family regulator